MRNSPSNPRLERFMRPDATLEDLRRPDFDSLSFQLPEDSFYRNPTDQLEEMLAEAIQDQIGGPLLRQHMLDMVIELSDRRKAGAW